MTDLEETRTAAIARTMDAVREAERTHGATRAGLAEIEGQLLALAARSDLFSFDHFPAPAADDDADSHIYRIAQDDDDRFALYIQATNGSISTPPHNHTTWACIVGLVGREHNQFYERAADGGVTKTSTAAVEPGTGVQMLPDDVHSIRIDGEALMFHCYGLALERLSTREFYDADAGRWVNNGGPRVIREARGEPHSA